MPESVSTNCCFKEYEKYTPIRNKIQHLYTLYRTAFQVLFWNLFCNKITADKLVEKVNEHAICFVFKDRYTPYEELLAKLGLSTLRHKQMLKIICNVYRSLNHSNYPASLKELLNLRQSKYSLRGKHILQIPKVNTTTYGLKSWQYQAAKLWNSLPDTAKAT